MRLFFVLFAPAVLLGGCYGFVGREDVRQAEDRDSDGVSYVDDCDDADAEVGASQTWYPDADGDGYGDRGAAGTASCDDLSTSASLSRTDCNDDDAAIAPNAQELCDDVDNDCDGAVDEMSECENHNTDADGDGFAADVDCDDANAAVYPNATEIWYDGIDQNCDEASDFDQDGDGADSNAYDGGDCDDAASSTHPGAPELCDDVDNDCDGVEDNPADDDGDGFHECGGDCDDADPDVNEDAYDLCDGLDNDCDGIVDQYDDEDLDGWTTCSSPRDCNDAAPEMYPGAEEVCDNIDNDCDGEEDEGFDLDGDRYTECGGDCDDSNPSINPRATEVPGNAVDENCDGIAEAA